MKRNTPRPRRPLTDLSLYRLRRALAATVAAAGPESYSAQALRRAIATKRKSGKEDSQK